MTFPLFAQGIGAFPASQRNAADAGRGRALEGAAAAGWDAAGRGPTVYTPDSSLADAIDRGEIVVAPTGGAEPDWN